MSQFPPEHELIQYNSTKVSFDDTHVFLREKSMS